MATKPPTNHIILSTQAGKWTCRLKLKIMKTIILSISQAKKKGLVKSLTLSTQQIQWTC